MRGNHFDNYCYVIWIFVWCCRLLWRENYPGRKFSRSKISFNERTNL